MLFASYKGYIHDLYWVLGIINNFPIFLELTLRCQKTPFSIFWCFRDQTTSKWPEILRGSFFWKERNVGAKESKKRRPDSLTAWGPPSWPSGLRCRRSFFPKLRLDLKTTIYRPPQGFRERERRRNTETTKQRPGAEDWRGKTPAGRCRCGLLPLQQHLHRHHDEEGVVHPWTMGLWK